VGFPYFLDPGPLYAVYVFFFFTVVVYAFYLLIRGLKTTTGFQKTQLAHVIGAYSFGYMGAICVFLPIYGIHMPATSIYPIAIAHLWILYSIFRHRLLDVKVVIRRTGLLLAIYIALLILIVPLIRLLHKNTTVPASEIILTGAFLSIGPFLYAFIVRRNTFFHEDTIAGLTHELKTPLAAIQSALEIILMAPTDSPHVNSDYLQMIRSNATRLEGFVDSLINVFGNGQMEISLNRERIDLCMLITQSVESMRSFAMIKGLSLTLKNPPGPVGIFADPVKLGQAISNMLSNAIKFTDTGVIEMALHHTKQEVRISVRDTGCGLSSDEMRHVFDRFYQGEAGRQKKGTGIGLTLAKHWVEAHGGQIEVASGGRGKGTTVTFFLPVE